MKNVTLADGIYTATLTPFNEDLSVNHELLAKHCQWLLANGSTGIAIMGTTGEANSLSTSERKTLIEEVIHRGIPANKLMVGTGCCSMGETIELTRHAVECGAGGILMLPPFYYKQVTDEGLTTYFSQVIDRVNDDRLEIYLYHFPQMSGMQLSVSLIAALAEKYPDQVVGLKDSSGDFANMQAVMHAIPDFKLYPGSERFLLKGLRIGSAGCVSATANADITLIAQVLANWQTSEADKLQDYLTSVRATFEGKPFTAIIKQYLAAKMGCKVWKGIRPPNELIAENIIEALIEKHKALNFDPEFYSE